MNGNQQGGAAAPEVSLATREQISRWLDGDIAPHEIDLAMTVLARQDGRYCWAEMHFVGDCIRGLENTSPGCADRIRAAIAAEPAIVAPLARQTREAREAASHRQRGVIAAMSSVGRGGRAWATAAAVAAVGFVGTVVYKDMMAPAPGSAMTASATAAAAAGVAATAASTVARPGADFMAYEQAHRESADVASLSPMRQYLRPAVIAQGQ